VKPSLALLSSGPSSTVKNRRRTRSYAKPSSYRTGLRHWSDCRCSMENQSVDDTSWISSGSDLLRRIHGRCRPFRANPSCPVSPLSLFGLEQ
jgi:hypothetical protein